MQMHNNNELMDSFMVYVVPLYTQGTSANKLKNEALNSGCRQDVHDFALRNYALKLFTQPRSKTASQLLLDVLETLVEKNLESPRYIACIHYRLHCQLLIHT